MKNRVVLLLIFGVLVPVPMMKVKLTSLLKENGCLPMPSASHVGSNPTLIIACIH